MKEDQPAIESKPSNYQPTKAELEEEIKIDAKPEELARALGRQVKIKYRTPS